MDPRRWRWPTLFFSAGVVALLVKESAWPVYVAGTLYLAYVARRGSGHPAGGAPGPAGRLAMGGLGLAVAIAAVILACGGPGEAQATWQTFRRFSAPNEYMRLYQTGSPAYYLVGLLILQPLTFTLGLVGAVAIAARPRWGTGGAPGRTSVPSWSVLAWLVIGFGTLAALYPQKNLSFVSPLVVPWAFLAAWSLRTLGSRVASRLPESRRRWVGIALAAVVVVSSILDLGRFQAIFVRRGIPDLATPWLLEAPGADHPAPGAR